MKEKKPVVMSMMEAESNSRTQEVSISIMITPPKKVILDRTNLLHKNKNK
jgi:hypothetical protein